MHAFLKVSSWSEPAKDLFEDINTWGDGAKQSLEQIGLDVNNWGDSKMQSVKKLAFPLLRWLQDSPVPAVFPDC